MVSKHFLTSVSFGLAILLVGADASLYAGHGGGGGGGGHGGGGGGGRGGSYSGGGYSQGGHGGGYGLGRGGFYGGGLFYGDYLTGGGYPGYFAPYVYPNSPYYYADPVPSFAPQYSTTPSTSYYFAPSAPVAKSASIHVLLPDPKATVLFDGNPTTSTGKDRLYYTGDLEPGSYSYTLRATWSQDGQQVTQEQTVAVRPGQTTEVVFARKSSEAVAAPSRK